MRKELARRTFDESGNYAVNPMVLDIKEHLNDGTNFGKYLDASNTASENPSGFTNAQSKAKFVIGIDQNKAYVQGNEIVTPLTDANPIVVDKPRTDGEDTVTISGASTLLEVGNYIKLLSATVKGIPDVTTQTTLNLRNAADTTIGTARAKGLEYIATGGTPAPQHRLYLYDIAMTGDNLFDLVENITQDAPTGFTQGFAADVYQTNSVTSRFESGKESLVYKIPLDVVAEDGHSSTWTYRIRIRVGDSSVSNNAASFTLPTGMVLANNDDIQVAVNGGVTVEASTVASGVSSQTFTLNSSNITGTISNGDKVQAIVTATVTNARRRSKVYDASYTVARNCITCQWRKFFFENSYNLLSFPFFV